jgi:hypothetical protein
MKTRIFIPIIVAVLTLGLGTRSAQARTQDSTSYLDWAKAISGQSIATPEIGSVFRSSMIDSAIGLTLGGTKLSFSPFGKDGSIDFNKTMESYSVVLNLLKEIRGGKDLAGKDLSMDSLLGLINGKVNMAAAGKTAADSQDTNAVSSALFDDSVQTFRIADQLASTVSLATNSLDASNNANKLSAEHLKVNTKNGAIAIQTVEQAKIANRQRDIDLSIQLAEAHEKQASKILASMDGIAARQNSKSASDIYEALTR